MDTGCEITMVPQSLVQRHRIRISLTERQIWAANGSEIELSGEAMIPFVLNDRRMDTFALVSPDIEEVIIGSDWLEKHRCLWNFGKKQLSIDGYSVATVTEKKNLRCRRLYSEKDVALPPDSKLKLRCGPHYCR